MAVISMCYIAALITVDLTMHQIVEPISGHSQYLEDFSNITGLILGLSLSIILWRKLRYGNEFIYGAFGLIIVTVPFTIISYFWNISGHVTFTAAPVTYLVLLDRRLVLLYVIPLIMVFNRPFVGAHTPLQSIAGFFLGTILMFWGIKAIQARREGQAGVT